MPGREAEMAQRRSIRRYGSRKYKKPFGERCKDLLRSFIAFMFSNVGIIGLVVSADRLSTCKSTNERFF